ncbi:hypothetical protein [Marinilabilia sp.]|uniref:hypothetical protein n=1 Tax=Marinilabilia sp. TaxID=2021252 RepID=UPI0025BD8334|nr:hypothetical protein [Marinilabilia sp.]
MRTACLLLMLTFGVNILTGQIDGRAVALGHIEQLAGAASLSGDKVFFIDSEIASFPRNDLTNPKRVKIKIYLSNDIQHYDAGIIQTYQDGNEVFFVVPDEKSVYRNNVVDSDMTANIVAMANLQKELIKSSELTAMEEHLEDGDKKWTINFKVLPEVTENSGVETMAFIYNETQEQIDEVKLRFSADNQLALQVMKYNRLSFDYRDEKMKAPASDYVLNRSGQLKEDFSGYQLIDLRDTNHE